MEKVTDKKFAWEVQEIYRRFEAMGVGRWDRIQQTRKGQVKERKQTAKANGKKKKKTKKKKKKKKPFTAADAHERGKAATPVVPMTASGMFNFESWAKGNGVGKKHVGMAVNKASVGNEMTSWGHVFRVSC